MFSVGVRFATGGTETAVVTPFTFPADAPIMNIALTSDKYEISKVYDLASTILEQKLSQIPGVGEVDVQGGATPSVRVEVNPNKLESFGLTLGNVQSLLSL